jgi:hypothetical protein
MELGMRIPDAMRLPSESTVEDASRDTLLRFTRYVARLIATGRMPLRRGGSCETSKQDIGVFLRALIGPGRRRSITAEGDERIHTDGSARRQPCSDRRQHREEGRRREERRPVERCEPEQPSPQ